MFMWGLNSKSWLDIVFAFLCMLLMMFLVGVWGAMFVADWVVNGFSFGTFVIFIFFGIGVWWVVDTFIMFVKWVREGAR